MKELDSAEDGISITIPRSLLPRTSPPLLVTIWNCTEILGVPPAVFRRWAKQGKFPCSVEQNGRYVNALYEDVKAWLQQTMSVRKPPAKPTAGSEREAIIARFQREG